MKRKHSVCAIILIVAMVGLILSCSNNPTLENKLEETGYVSFGNAGSRSLSVMYEMENIDDLYWTYTAKKADGYGQTGQTTSEQPVPSKANGKGIGNGTVGPFSMGDWDFNLFAYKDAEKTIKVYEGKTPSRVNIIAGDTKNVSVAVSPFGITGVLKIENAYFHWDSTSGGALPVINLTMDKNKSDETADKSFDITPVVNENGDITFALYEDEISVGFYYCKLKATIDTASTPIYETEEFTLRIYGATTTTIFGDITEQTGPSVRFSATKSDNSELTTITGTDVREVSVNATPTGSDTTTVNFGTYNIGTSETPREDGKTTKVTHALEVAVSSSDTVDTSDTNRFIVDSGKDAVAALDLTLIKKTEIKDTAGTIVSTTTEPVTTFGDGNEVTITTYVAKNLFDVKVRYNNGTEPPEEITPEDYNAATGELVFKVSHFSEYYVTAKLPEAKIEGTYYPTLKDALDGALNGDTVELLKDCIVETNIRIPNSITIDLSGKELCLNKPNSSTYGCLTFGENYQSKKSPVRISIKNGTIRGNTFSFIRFETGSEGVFENISFVLNEYEKGIQNQTCGRIIQTYATSTSNSDPVNRYEFNNCTFDRLYTSFEGGSGSSNNYQISFNDCDFTGETMTESCIIIDDYDYGTLTLSNVTFDVSSQNGTLYCVNIVTYLDYTNGTKFNVNLTDVKMNTSGMVKPYMYRKLYYNNTQGVENAEFTFNGTNVFKIDGNEVELVAKGTTGLVWVEDATSYNAAYIEWQKYYEVKPASYNSSKYYLVKSGDYYYVGGQGSQFVDRPTISFDAEGQVNEVKPNSWYTFKTVGDADISLELGEDDNTDVQIFTLS